VNGAGENDVPGDMVMIKRKAAITFAEVLAVLLLVVIFLAVILPAVQRTREARNRAQCQDILRQWGQAFALYSSESPGNRYPPAHIVNRQDSRYPDNPDGLEILGSPQLETIYPDYVNNPDWITCPSDIEAQTTPLLPENSDDNFKFRYHYLRNFSYFYAGWLFDRLGVDPALNAREFPFLMDKDHAIIALMPERERYVTGQFALGLKALLDTVAEAKDQKNPGLRYQAIADGPLSVPAPYGNGGGNTLHRLGVGVERFLLTDPNDTNAAAKARSRIWVMMDMFASLDGIAFFNHIPGGSNVLYMDGSVSFVRFTSAPPDSGPDRDRFATPPVMPGMGDILYMFNDDRSCAY
jgi:prepilin-type processing-associated H-X9-DG protein